ncbi:cold shock domain-containing protein [Ralstonia wenshanensis]|uniref:cold shock domain-containing protein n=2 Tax=Ralstonia wenshanensis TaxID=2842456 RepID=UPI003743AA93
MGASTLSLSFFASVGAGTASACRIALCRPVDSRPIWHLLHNRRGASMDREQGVVKWFDSRSGVGLIEPQRGGDGVIVIFPRSSALDPPALQHGQKVTFVRGLGRVARTAAKLLRS